MYIYILTGINIYIYIYIYMWQIFFLYIYTRIFGRASRGLDSFYDLSPDMHCSGTCLIANKHSSELEPCFRDQYAAPLKQHVMPGTFIW